MKSPKRAELIPTTAVCTSAAKRFSGSKHRGSESGNGELLAKNRAFVAAAVTNLRKIRETRTFLGVRRLIRTSTVHGWKTGKSIATRVYQRRTRIDCTAKEPCSARFHFLFRLRCAKSVPMASMRASESRLSRLSRWLSRPGCSGSASASC